MAQILEMKPVSLPRFPVTADDPYDTTSFERSATITMSAGGLSSLMAMRC
jgi:hypothetical protein